MYFKSSVVRAVIHNVTFVDPPSHCLEVYANWLEISHVSVLAPESIDKDDPDDESHNTDALDVHGEYMYIHHVNFTTGDDNVALHANHTLVEDSYFGTGHGASVGSCCDVWLHNLTVRNVVFNGTTAGMRIKTHPKCAGMTPTLFQRFRELFIHNRAS